MLSRLIFSILIVSFFLLGFVFHMKNERTVLVDYIFSEGSFKVSWVVLISMLTGSLLAALTILPGYLKKAAKIWQMKKKYKKALSDSQR